MPPNNPGQHGSPSSPGSHLTPWATGGPTPPPRIPDYELIRLIGSGSYGDVWLARSIMNTYRAVKVVYRDRFDNDRPYDREFEGIRKFEPISRTHESQVDILHIGRDDAAGHFYYVMELADDANVECGMRSAESPDPAATPHSYAPRTLRLELQQRHRLPIPECLQLGLALSTALEHLHGHGLIHRDIKPSNIIFVNGRPKLADIGLVTETDKTMSFVGTAGYLPPEGPGSVQGDIYSLGKVLYEVCTGKDRQEFPELPSALGEQSNDEALLELNEIIVRACHHDARQRYSSAHELFEDLWLLQKGKSVRRTRAVERRLNVAKNSLAVAGIIAVLATAGYFYQRQQTRAVTRNLYAANMNLAQRDWDKANVGRLSQLLTETESYSDKGFEWYYWQRQLHLDQKTLRGHSNAVSAVAFSPDGRRLVSASADHTAILWDAARGMQLTGLKDHTGPVASVAYSPDGNRIATASRDGTARIWDASSGQQVIAIKHSAAVLGVAFSPDGQRIATVSRITVNNPLTVLVWNAFSGEKLQVLTEKTPGHGLSSIAFSADGQRILAITGRFEARVWDGSTGRELMLFKAPRHEYYSAAISPDGQRIVTGGSAAAVWDANTGEQLFTLQNGTQHGVGAVAYSPDGKVMVTAGGDRRVILWDAATGTELFRLAGHHGAINSVAFSQDGQHIATASADGTVKLWDAKQMQNPRTLPNRTTNVNRLAISPDGTRVATTLWDKTVRITELASGRELLALAGHTNGVVSIAFSPDGRRIATGNGWNGPQGQNRAKIWDASTGRELLTLNGSGFVAFSPDGKRIATSSGSRSATIWNAHSGEEVIQLNGHSNWVHSTAFSPDGKRIATSSEDWTIRIWDAARGRELLAIQRPKHGNQNRSSVTFSPDGRRIALANNDQTPRIWDASTGRELLTLNGHTEMVACISWSLDGRRVLTSGYDRSAKVWDAITGRELLTLEGYARAVTASAFTPDGRSIVTAGFDGLTTIWQAASPAQVADWRK